MDAPPSGNGYAVLQALDRFRSDVRADLGDLRDEARSDITALEGRLMAAIGENHRALTDYSTTHNGVHAAERVETQAAFAESRAAHDRWDDFIETSKLSQARRDGALGATRYVVDLLASNAAALVRIALASGLAAWLASGSVHISLGT